jgi:hypothetical protein
MLIVTILIIETVILAAMFGYVVRLKRCIDLVMMIVNRLGETQNNILIVMREASIREALNTVDGVTRNSPLVVPQEVQALYAPFIDDVKAWYDEDGKRMEEHQAWLYIAARWKDELTKNVCLPLKIDSNACAEMALNMVKYPHTGDSWKRG